MAGAIPELILNTLMYRALYHCQESLVDALQDNSETFRSVAGGVKGKIS